MVAGAISLRDLAFEPAAITSYPFRPALKLNAGCMDRVESFIVSTRKEAPCMVIAGKHIPVKSILYHVIGLIVGSMIYSAGLNLFLVPNQIIDGGVVGIGLIAAAISPVPFSVWVVLLNIPFFLVGYKKVGASLALYAMAAVCILSFWSPIFEEMEPVTTDPFLATIFGGMIIGIGVGLVIKSGGSLDGTEILAIWLDRKCSFTVGEIVMFFNVFILGSAGFVFSWNSAMYSLVAYFICAKMIDMVSNGLDESKGVFIVTDQSDEVADAIMNRMHRAVTFLHGEGGFLKNDKKILYCVISRLEVTRLKFVTHDIDPQAFLSIFDVREVQGGFMKKKKH